MRYHTELGELNSPFISNGEIEIDHECFNHPVFNYCTLYKIGGKGLGVVQQRMLSAGKRTWWSGVDPQIATAIYNHPKFIGYFNEHAKPANEDGLYPTIPVRKVMWALRMKPLKKELWETTFDREVI